MPRRAAPPTAETTATGTEITSEHGQATISSASARYSHVSASPPNASGTVASSSAAREHDRRVDRGEAVDEALGGRAAALGLLDERGDARERRVRGRPGRAARRARRWCSACRRTARRPAALSTGTDSPVIGAWSTLECPAITSASSGIRSPGLHAISAPTGTAATSTSSLVVADQHARAGRGEVHQRRDDPAAALERHRLQPGADREQHEHPGAFGVRADARPRRPRPAPSARSCPAGGGAGRAPRPARSASRRRPSRAGTAARPPLAAPTPAKRPRPRRAARSRAVVESGARVAAPERRVVVLDRARRPAAPGTPRGDTAA